MNGELLTTDPAALGERNELLKANLDGALEEIEHLRRREHELRLLLDRLPLGLLEMSTGLRLEGKSLGDSRGACILLTEASAADAPVAPPESEGSGLHHRIVMGTVLAMSEMVARRDPFVAGHQKRVAQLAVAIGAEMGLDTFTIDGLHIACLLHDVGKVAIPAEILCKPAAVNQAERNIIRTHPLVAHRIIKRIEFPWPIAEAVLQHAERLDGSGYPRGLRGDQICGEARILAVADVVEAMLTYRPYRPAHELDVVMAEIDRGAGRLFDPDVVRICRNLFMEKDFEFIQI